jgi:transposase-like protein
VSTPVISFRFGGADENLENSGGLAMFSEDDRIKAVQHFIKFDLKAEATVRALGYPCSKTLKAWYREFLASGKYGVSRTRKTRFSAEERTIAVNYYLDHGRCAATTIRALGYPGPDTFRKWLRSQEPELVRATARRVEPFSEDEKRRAVISLCLRESPATSIARSIGVSRFRLYTWKHQLLGDEEAAVARKKVSQSSTQQGELEKAEVQDLERQLCELRLERDILLRTNELLKKETGISPRELGNREKTLVVDALRLGYRVSEILTKVSLASSSYFYHRSRLQLPDRHAAISSQIVVSFQENNRVYGYR